jgi:hypothetical protein
MIFAGSMMVCRKCDAGAKGLKAVLKRSGGSVRIMPDEMSPLKVIFEKGRGSLVFRIGLADTEPSPKKENRYSREYLNKILQSETPDAHEEQRARQRSAQKCQVISIDLESQSGEFKGSGEEEYSATLTACTCKDFIMRNLPCKHIYRLAHELGRFDLKTGKWNK